MTVEHSGAARSIQRMNAVAAPAIRLSVPVLADFARVAMVMRPDEREQFMAFSGLSSYEPDVIALALANQPGPKWVMLDGADQAIFIGGFVPIRPGVFEAWLAGSMRAWRDHGHAITRVCRREVTALLSRGAHRVQTTALANRSGAHVWYERALGMQREGIHSAYGANGEDAVTFAKVRA